MDKEGRIVMATDISIVKGMTLKLPVTVTDVDNSGAKSLTSATISWNVWQHPTPSTKTAVITKAIGTGIAVTNAGAGQFTITVDPADTASLAETSFSHTCVVTDSNGDKEVVFSGTFNITPLG